jgi:hypothetical protein
MTSTVVEGYNVLEYKKACIYIIDDIMDSELCNEIIELIKKIPMIKKIKCKGSNVECYVNILQELLDYDDTHYYYFNNNENNNEIKLTNNLNGVKKEYLKNIEEIITNKIKIIRNILLKINGHIKLNYNSGYCFRKIYGQTHKHIDGLNCGTTKDEVLSLNNDYNNEIVVRNTSIIFALNDDYEGGIFNFHNYDLSFKLKRGSVILFPPYWNNPHSVTAVEKNYRYTINTWSYEKIGFQ